MLVLGRPPGGAVSCCTSIFELAVIEVWTLGFDLMQLTSSPRPAWLRPPVPTLLWFVPASLSSCFHICLRWIPGR